MKKTARVIVTYNCPKKCEGCCNTKIIKPPLTTIQKLATYDEVVITGGEPLLYLKRLEWFIKKLYNEGFIGDLYLYTSYWSTKTTPRTDVLRESVIRKFNGVTYTLHTGSDEYIKELKAFMEEVPKGNKNIRVFVDSRIYDSYDLSNINWSRVDVIRKLQWNDNCATPPHEDLLYFELG